MALQDTIDAAVSGAGSKRVGDLIELGKEVIDLHDTLRIANRVNGMLVRGRGPATRFRWLGDDRRPVFSFTDGNRCELSDVTVELVRRAKTLVQMCDTKTGPIRSSHNTLRNISVPDAGKNLETFWHIGGGEDNKNDFMRGDQLDVAGCEVGVVIEGKNALNHVLTGCQFKGRSAGQVGIRTSDGGSIRVFGGCFIQFANAVFDLDTLNGVAVAAYGVHIEKCRRLLITPSAAPGPTSSIVILDGLRWGSAASEMPKDGEIVTYQDGTLVVRGCWFGTSTPNKTVYRFRYSATAHAGDFVFEDCRVRASNPDGHWPEQPPRSVAGSLLDLPNQPPQPMPAS
jgi:hypothetical protein